MLNMRFRSSVGISEVLGSRWLEGLGWLTGFLNLVAFSAAGNNLFRMSGPSLTAPGFKVWEGGA